MRNIEITDGARTVTLLPALEYQITPEEIGKSATMASGREVYDFVGTKNVLTIPVGWLSPADLALLRRMIHEKHILTISYQLPEGDRSGLFLVKQPKLKSFKYDSEGVTQWYGVTLTATQYEVDV